LEKVNSLYAEIRAVLEKSRSSAYRAVNLAMVQAYWQIGYLIVEHEQEGKERAEYGKAILKDLSRCLTREFGKGYSVQALRNMRQFYLVFSKRSAVRSESSGGIKPAVDKDRSQLHSQVDKANRRFWETAGKYDEKIRKTYEWTCTLEVIIDAVPEGSGITFSKPRGNTDIDTDIPLFGSINLPSSRKRGIRAHQLLFP